MMISFLKTKLLIAFGVLLSNLARGQNFSAFNTTQCISQCFNIHQNATFCNYGREYGICCAPDDNNNTLCQSNPSQGVYCSNQILNNQNIMQYTYCPRHTKACSTQGRILTPLLNQNQTVNVNNQMFQENGDVCFWELKVDLNGFQNNHPMVALTDAYINLNILTQANVTVYQTQGNSRTNTSNMLNPVQQAVGNTSRYPLSGGNTVYLIAFPSDQTDLNVSNSFNFTFNISADYYPPQGMTVQLQADILPDISRNNYWWFIGGLATVVFLIMLFVFFYICCKDFDPANEFEIRRSKVAKERKKQEALQKKQKAKDDKQSKKNQSKKPNNQDSQKKKQAKKYSDEEEEYYEEEEVEREVKPPPKSQYAKGAKSQEVPAARKKPVKSLETEVKLKEDNRRKREDFNMPLLDDDDD